MEEKLQPKPTKPVKPAAQRSRWKLFRRGILIFLLLVVVFHRPIFFGLLRFGANLAEKNAHLKIDYTLGGSLFTNLRIDGLKITGPADKPLKEVHLAHAYLTYDLWKLVTKGKVDFLQTVELRDFLLHLDLTKAPPPKRQPRKKNAPIIPIPFPRSLSAAGVTIQIQQKNGLLNIQNATLTLPPSGQGVLRVDELAIPNLPVMKNLAATTTYVERDLNVHDLVLQKNLVIQRAQVDASILGEQRLDIRLNALAFSGPVAATILFSNLGATNEMDLSASAHNVSLPELGAFFQPAAGLKGNVDALDLLINGEADNLTTWNGSLRGQITQPGIHDFEFGKGEINCPIRGGQLSLEKVQLTQGEQVVSLGGSLQLPGRKPEEHPFLADLHLQVQFPELAKVCPKTFGGGSFTANGLLNVQLTTIHTHLEVDGPQIDLVKGSITALKGQLDFVKTGGAANKGEVWWKNTHSKIDLSTGPLMIGGYQIDRSKALLTSQNAQMKLGLVEIDKGSNQFSTEGVMVFSSEMKPVFPGVLDLALKITAPNLRELSVDPVKPIVDGVLNGTGTLHMDNPKADVALKLTGSKLEHQGVALGELAADVTLHDQRLSVASLQLTMPDKGWLQATGRFDLPPASTYAAQLSTNLPDLARFKPLLPSLASTSIGGALQIDFAGSGSIPERLHEGKTGIYLKGGRFGEVKDVELRTAGYYTPSQADFPDLLLKTSKGDLSAIIHYADRQFSLQSLKLTQRGELRLAGEIAFPLDLEKALQPKELLPRDGEISINLTGKDVDLGKLQSDIGLTPQVAGLLSLSIVASKTLGNPDLNLQVTGKNLHSEKLAKLDPADLNLALKLTERQATLDGSVKQSLIQPLSIKGTLPFDVAGLLDTGKLNTSAPVKLAIHLPPSSLESVPKYVPILRSIDGTLGIDVGVEGTLGKPTLSGGLVTSVKTLRFRNNSLPSIRGININAAFRENVLRFNQFSGDLAGGPFKGSGSINLKDVRKPVFDIKLDGQSILFARNDNIIVRSDLDLTLKGPIATAELSGKIGITDSRFFREIDILPINLPGRPAPTLPGGRPSLSIAVAPIRDWKFNVDIVTKDNFLIRGNMANGDITANVHLGGTGLAPFLEGNIQFYNLLASLPFSRLRVDYGNLYFGRELPPLSPILDLRGSSRIRDYNIDVYMWGDAIKPSTLFLSQPPLSQEDILTLLATGVTQTELAENPQLLAGRAGVLLLQKYYNQLFRRNTTSEENSPLDNVDIQIGTIDPKTGRESATARVLLNDNWQIVGDLDVEGGVRGQLKYLIRFK